MRRSLSEMRRDEESELRRTKHEIQRLEARGAGGSPEYWEKMHHLYRTRDVISAIDWCISLFGAGSRELDNPRRDC